ncbi:MAG: hypothetical protein ABII22_03950 [Candidatus Micrarchaeota archaeon]
MGNEPSVVESIKKAFGLFSNGKLLTNFSKISLLEAGVQAVLVVLVFASLLSALLSVSKVDPSNSELVLSTLVASLLSAGIFILFLGLIAILALTIINSIFWYAIHAHSNNKHFNLWNSLKEAAVPMTKLFLVYLLGGVLAVGVLVVSAITCVLLPIAVIGLLILVFSIVFMVPEILINKKGIVDSFKTSWRILRTYPLKVIALVLASGLIAAVPNYILSTVSDLLMDNLGTNLALIFAVTLVIGFLQILIDSIILVGSVYYFWMDVPKAVQKKPSTNRK